MITIDEKLVTERLQKIKFSWSSFDSYNKCPLQFYHRYILEQIPPSNISAFYGSALHALLDDIYKNENFYSKAVYAKWDRILQKEWKTEWKKDQYKNITLKQVESIKFLGFKHIKNFFIIAEKENLLRPVEYSEKKLNANYKNHKITAKLDIIIKINGELVIIDWKTGKPKKEDLIQLVLYAAIFSKMEQKEIKKVAICYLNEGKIYYKDITPELKEKVSKYILSIYNRIISDKSFLPTPHEYCKNCNLYKTICPL